MILVIHYKALRKLKMLNSLYTIILNLFSFRLAVSQLLFQFSFFLNNQLNYDIVQLIELYSSMVILLTMLKSFDFDDSYSMSLIFQSCRQTFECGIDLMGMLLLSIILNLYKKLLFIFINFSFLCFIVRFQESFLIFLHRIQI